MPKAPKAMISSPLASPSKPSVKLTAFAVAKITKINNGIYQRPNSMASAFGIGTEILLNPNLL